MELKRVKIWLDVLRCLFLTFGGVKANIQSAEETVEAIVRGKSLIRFGDGEFGIYKGKNIHYQPYSPALKREFEKIKETFEAQGADCPYVLAMPRHFMRVPGTVLMKKRVYVSSWAQARYYFKRHFDLSLPYGDSFLFEKRNKALYSRIWDNEACPGNIVFLHNDPQYATYFADTYHKNTVFVPCPPKDAFAEIDRLEQAVLQAVAQNGWDKTQVMLTVSAGPAGKVLCYRLSAQGYHCVDAGHCWDDPLES